MRNRCLPVFVVTLLLAWAFLFWFGDFNEYVGDVYKDGRVWVKAKATLSDRVAWSFGLAVVFSVIEMGILIFLDGLAGHDNNP